MNGTFHKTHSLARMLVLCNSCCVAQDDELGGKGLFSFAPAMVPNLLALMEVYFQREIAMNLDCYYSRVRRLNYFPPPNTMTWLGTILHPRAAICQQQTQTQMFVMDLVWPSMQLKLGHNPT